MASSSSSSSGSQAPGLYGYWLYSSSYARVAYVALPATQPPLVVFQNIYYVWSNILWAYVQTTPYTIATVAPASVPAASVLANPQF